MRPTPPAKLYKYMHAGRSDFFIDWMIRFSQPSVLNDPFELKPHISDVATVSKTRRMAGQKFDTDLPNWRKVALQNRGKKNSEKNLTKLKRKRNQIISQTIKDVQQRSIEMSCSAIAQKLEQNVASLCLSQNPSSLLMWSHYADSHRGFVIEFDTTAPFFKQIRPPVHVHANSEEIASFRAEYGVPRRIDYHATRPATLATKLTFDLLLTKGCDWKYEEEWRMLMPPDYASYWAYSEKIKDQLIFLFEVPPNCITSVIIGCNAGDSLKSQILGLRDNSATSHIQIQQAEIDDVDYKLNFQIV